MPNEQTVIAIPESDEMAGAFGNKTEIIKVFDHAIHPWMRIIIILFVGKYFANNALAQHDDVVDEEKTRVTDGSQAHRTKPIVQNKYIF